MPLDTSTYNLALLRTDGRRWNELRHLSAQISTQAAADGSSYLEMGNTKVICTVTGPSEGKGGGGSGGDKAEVKVEISVAGFSGVDRKKRRTDKRISEMCTTIENAFSNTLFLHLFPHSLISLQLHILSQDGSLLAALINASTLALIDAGIPMRDYLCACTAGSTSSYSSNDEAADPLLDLNLGEEQELPFLTVGTLGGSEKDEDSENDVCVLVMETRVQVGRLEGMLVVGVDGCGEVRKVLDRVIREGGKALVDESKM